MTTKTKPTAAGKQEAAKRQHEEIDGKRAGLKEQIAEQESTIRARSKDSLAGGSAYSEAARKKDRESLADLQRQLTEANQDMILNTELVEELEIDKRLEWLSGHREKARQAAETAQQVLKEFEEAYRILLTLHEQLRRLNQEYRSAENGILGDSRVLADLAASPRIPKDRTPVFPDMNELRNRIAKQLADVDLVSLRLQKVIV